MNKLLTGIFSVSLLAGCLEESEKNTATYEGAAIVTIDSGFTASDLAVIDKEYQVTESLYPQAFSDVSISKGLSSLYLINKFGQNNVIKFDNETLGEVVWQYTTNSDIEGQNSNPYQVIEVSETKAYIIRYGAGEVWEVDPTAITEEDFKLSEIDISHFDNDGIPEANAAVLHNNVLYIALQRQVFFKADQAAYLIAIDTNTNEILDLSPNDTSTDAFTLKIVNPENSQLVGNHLFLSAVGRRAVKDWDTGEILEPIQYSGGIERVDLTNLSSEIIIDDGDQDSHPYGQINSVSVHGDSIVFNGYAGWQDLSTYIKSGEETPVHLDENLNGKDIRFAEFDATGNLWVGVSEEAENYIKVYEKDGNTYQVIETIYTTLIPSEIIFN